ncbi:hypothetical protein EXIGLDRAFT_782076 [Exidia glandulosa HHB12029]|uniref:Uncharacterized protein n=1 Tax=Exidia glandulosa HHB12029 TaxID=1314781 RepID=A0A165Z5P9_EXIGL|nr:hypothetical protein EXIGLDRAFT_782076 [Exidia glandulosa HHB12029]
MANPQAPFTIDFHRATAIGSQMLVVVCGDRQYAMVVVANAFFATTVYIAYAYNNGGRVPPTAYMVLVALAAVWGHLTAAPTPTPTTPA